MFTEVHENAFRHEPESDWVLKTVTATLYVRGMRGGSQAQLLEADDGHSYIVKFQNNPQHRRILINELIASALLGYCNVQTPKTALVRVTPEFLAMSPKVCFETRTGQKSVEPGLHFGSRHPGYPRPLAVHDFLPDTLFSLVSNQSDFVGALVFDKWITNADKRQAIFFRDDDLGSRLRGHYLKPCFKALMIDNGFAFNGQDWNFFDSPVLGIFPQNAVYFQVRSMKAFDPWIQRLNCLPSGLLDQIRQQIPEEWMQQDNNKLDNMLHRLFVRRRLVADLIVDTQRSDTNPFVNWR